MNSVLIEGVIAEIKAVENGKITFAVESNRLYKDGRKLVKKTNVFTVNAAGKTAEYLATAKGGAKVRVVGRLESNGSAVTIEAEHAEFRLAA